MRKQLSLKCLVLTIFFMIQSAHSDDPFVSPGKFSDYLKSRFEICDAIGGTMVAAKKYKPELYDWKSVEECVNKSKDSAATKYKDVRSQNDLNSEAVRSLKSLLAYWQASMDLLKSEGESDLSEYSEMVDSRKAALAEKINLFMLDAAP